MTIPHVGVFTVPVRIQAEIFDCLELTAKHVVDEKDKSVPSELVMRANNAFFYPERTQWGWGLKELYGRILEFQALLAGIALNSLT